MSALPDTGSVVITVGVRPGSRRVLDVRSTRGPMVARLLRGRLADDRLASLVGLVYTLCPVSQASAWLTATGSRMRVVFNVFKDLDRQLYEHLLNV